MPNTHVIVLRFSPVGNQFYNFDPRRTLLMSGQGAYADLDRADKFSERQAVYCANSAARSLQFIDSAVAMTIEDAKAALVHEARVLGDPVLS